MGPGTPFPELGRAITMRDVADGTSQTIHFIQAAPDDAVPWTQPEDLVINLNDPTSVDLLNKLAATPGLNAVTFDGAIGESPPALPENPSAD